MVTLLGPLGGGLAGVQIGVGMASGIFHATMSPGPAMHEPTTIDGSGIQHHAGQRGCNEPVSTTPHRCAGLWSTTCCDYFAPGTKIKIDPSLESSARVLDALAVVQTVGDVEPAAVVGHLILPTLGEGRAGPTSLVILHSALLF
jgi:hypothetical protein